MNKPRHDLPQDDSRPGGVLVLAFLAVAFVTFCLFFYKEELKVFLGP